MMTNALHSRPVSPDRWPSASGAIGGAAGATGATGDGTVAAAAATAAAAAATKSLRLARAETVGLWLPADALIRVTQGRIWLTISGDRRDYFLSAGATHRIGRAGLVVCEGDSAGASTLAIDNDP